MEKSINIDITVKWNIKCLHRTILSKGWPQTEIATFHTIYIFVFDDDSTLTMLQSNFAQVMKVFSTLGALNKILWTTQGVIWISLVMKTYLTDNRLLNLWQCWDRTCLRSFCWIDWLSFCTATRSPIAFVDTEGAGLMIEEGGQEQGQTLDAGVWTGWGGGVLFGSWLNILFHTTTSCYMLIINELHCGLWCELQW